MALTTRQQKIIDYLKDNKYATIAEVADLLFISEATIRRELIELQKLGLVERLHGGAAIVETADDVALHIRAERDTIDKRETADIAIRRLPSFKTVFMDNSSTALVLSKKLDLRFKTVITNGIALATELSKREDVTVLMPGGNLLYNSNALSGALTIRGLEDYHFGLVVVSCASITEEGTFENSLEQSELKRCVLARCTNKVLLVDRTKFEKQATYKTSDLSGYHAIFTNADNETLEPFRRLKGVNFINK